MKEFTREELENKLRIILNQVAGREGYDFIEIEVKNIFELFKKFNLNKK